MATYGLLDTVYAAGVDLLARGYSRAVLELNHTVLYGVDSGYNARHERAIEASEERFYNGDDTAKVQGVSGGIADLIGWCENHRRLNPCERAAGVMIRTLASPKLFVEGNHRTSVLLASYELLRAQMPPSVFSAKHANELLACVKPIAQLTRGSLTMWIHERRVRKKQARLILRSISDEHLMP